MSQNYANHRRFVPMYHYVTFSLAVALLIGSIVNLVKSFGTDNLYSASLIVVAAVVLKSIFFFARVFALRAQDRAIRAEENLRHYVLTGKLLDPKLTTRQIVGLRFAQDAEFVALAQKAVAENLSEDDIKKAITSWKADNYRV